MTRHFAPRLVSHRMTVVAARPAPERAAQAFAMADVVEAACAEVGLTIERHPDWSGEGMPWWKVLAPDDRVIFEKAKALAFDRFGVPYEWVERPVMVLEQAIDEEVSIARRD